MFKKLPALALGLLLCAVSWAQQFPTQPIKIVVAFPPGGAPDIVARVISEPLAKELGQSVIVENRAGASGIPGTSFVANAKPDGHTLLMGNISPIGANPATFAQLPYDSIKSFSPIALVAQQPFLICVRNNLPVKDLREFIDYARKNPGKVSYGAAGSVNQLATEQFSSLVGVKMLHVPYKGSAPAIMDLVGGQIDVMFDPISSIYPQVKAGKIRVLATTTGKRSASAPEVPSAGESGLTDFNLTSWQGLMAPADTPPQVIARLNAAVAKVAALPSVKEQLAKGGIEVSASSPEEFAAFIAQEVARWKRVASAAGIEPQ